MIIIEQLKRMKLNDEKDLKQFIKTLNNNQITLEPASMAELLINAFWSKNENLSAITWFIILRFLSNFTTKLDKNQQTLLDAYILIIRSIFQSCKHHNLILPHFKNHIKWARKIMSEMTPQLKTQIYVTDIYILKNLNNKYKNYEYVTLKTHFAHNESIKIQQMVTAHCQFLGINI